MTYGFVGLSERLGDEPDRENTPDPVFENNRAQFEDLCRGLKGLFSASKPDWMFKEAEVELLWQHYLRYQCHTGGQPLRP